MSTPHLRLITRGDDAGSCSAANRAVLEACERDAERRALTDPRLAEALRERAAEIVRYTDVS